MVTVLMPVYNGEKYLKEAIDSVLNQTYKEFEFLIINDGSSDKSLEIINSYRDKRIRLINNEKNLRLISTLNKGLALANGKYIARMDCDDICFPERLQLQVDFMEANPEIGILGSWYIRTDNSKVVKKPLSHEDIKVNLLKGASILHPTAVFRKNLFDKHSLRFDQGYIHAEDYELWVRASEHFKLANLPIPLIHYRKHPNQVSQSYAKEQKETTIKIMAYQLEQMGIQPVSDASMLNFQLFTKTRLNNKQVNQLLSYVDLLISTNEKALYFDQEALKKLLFMHKDLLWDRCHPYSLNTLKIYHKSVKTKTQDFSLKLYIKILKRIVLNAFNLFKKEISLSN